LRRCDVHAGFQAEFQADPWPFGLVHIRSEKWWAHPRAPRAMLHAGGIHDVRVLSIPPAIVIAVATCLALVDTLTTAVTLDLAATARCLEGVAPVLRVRLQNAASLPADTRRTLMEEATSIWKASGVTVRWTLDVNPLVPGDVPSDVQVIVTLAAATPDAISFRRPLAAIQFVNGAPTTRITAFPAEAERILAGIYLDDRLLASRPAALRERMLGRVLGRAVAHEVGHFLFRTAHHTEHGLMRAHHRTDDLIGPSRGPFQVIVPQLATCAATETALATR
jgi:hypothetical protein